MKRTVVAHGTVCAPYGVFRAHVVIEGEQVVALGDDEALLAGADEIVDAEGLHVLPGAVDPHVHYEDLGHAEREDYATGTMAAAAGGITTIVEHPLTIPLPISAAAFAEKRDRVREKVVVDFGLWGALTRPSLPEIPGQWHEGARGFKAFMPFSEPEYPNVDDAELLAGMELVASFDGLVLVHAENDAMLRANHERLRAEGRRDALAHHESRPPLVEEEAVHRALFLAQQAGVRLQVVHVSSPVSGDLIAQAKARGQRATMEVCPHHLLLDLDDLVRLGPYGRCAPALRDRSLVERLWEHVLSGNADCLVSDHAPYTRAEKEPGWDDVFAAPLGLQVLQESVPAVLSEAVHVRGMSLDAFVRFSATNAARIVGLYPRKGTILPGSDADLVVWDLDAEWTVDTASQQLSKNPWSPFDGRTVRGRVVRTLVRGETVYYDGEIRVEPGYGRFLPGAGASVLDAAPSPAAG
ncbi:MAG TPA: allantoinase AllB [Gaiellaceae bacterium]|jgi:allantoinase